MLISNFVLKIPLPVADSEYDFIYYHDLSRGFIYLVLQVFISCTVKQNYFFQTLKVLRMEKKMKQIKARPPDI